MAKDSNTAVGDFGDEDGAEAAVIASLAEQFPNMAEETPEDTIARMAKRMLAADTVEARFDALSGNSSDKLVGKSFEFNGVTWQTYKSDRGQIPQAVCNVVDMATGEATEFVTTATMLVFFLRGTELHGQFPFKARIVEKTTARGNKALNFERA